ncbi:hypothetical protein [Pseudomonas sp. AL03]|uniref:hypothetical protein n=1 Tax=Pseudomonas sp. AL03 TaxID=3042230 RepID=UPI00249C6B1D|nr:hypothetical protein [Pseudomonas sp. AL03]MDI3274183.1 hypothetical protein [Pseudomonas sp. AL03]
MKQGTFQMLALVGSNPTVLNTKIMDEQKLHRNIKGFDPENVTPKQEPGNDFHRKDSSG